MVDLGPTARRIVSLVPSVTETLFRLGLGPRVVGVTDWCIHPAAGIAGLPRVGGTKNPDVEAIVALRADLVIANLEENREADVGDLRARGLRVWVDYPRTVAAALEQIGWLARLGDGETIVAAEAIAAPIRRAVAGRADGSPPPATFLGVWKNPWMTIGRDTYAHDLLETAGLRNVFAEHPDPRYPRTTLDEIASLRPDLVILPDEPYRFTQRDADELRTGALARTPAGASGRIHVIDGTLPFWHGPRIGDALALLATLRG